MMKSKIKIILFLFAFNTILWVTPFIFLFSSSIGKDNANEEISDAIISTFGFSPPVNEPYQITAGFNSADSVHNGSHDGVDFVPSGDDTVISGSSGTVSYTSDECPPFGGYLGNYCGYGFGNFVIVKTEVEDTAYRVIYGHMSKIDVKEGDIVTNGERLGVMGNSGNSTGAHVHYQIEYQNSNGKWTAVNPIPLLAVSNIDNDKTKIMQEAGISPSDYDHVDYIISHESSWNYKAQNPTSSAYGLCQALPGTKMESAGSDWRTNPVTQMKWCDGYAKERYGSWQEAENYWKEHNWW